MTDRQGIVVLGAGYVGLITAVGLVKLGHKVELVETRADRRTALERGVAPIFEKGVNEVLGPAVADGRIVVRGSISNVAPDLILICVGTPIADDGSSDLSQLVAALATVRGLIADGAAVVIRSTMPVGGTSVVIRDLGLPSSQIFLNPEFLRQGTALDDFLMPSRVVIGSGEQPDAALLRRVEALVAAFDAPLLKVTYAEAELIKNAANAFLALKLSFVNELAILTEAYGGDIDHVVSGLAHDPRIGGTYLRPSYGFGGSCLPKELQTLAAAGWERGVSMHVTAAAAAANASTQEHFAGRIADAVGGLEGRTIAMLGLAFKAGTDDVRESPSLNVAGLLRDRGARVRGYDPEAGTNALQASPWLEVCRTAEAAVAGADAAVIATEWAAFKSLDWGAMQSTMHMPVIVDGRRMLDPIAMRGLGYRYAAVGTGDGAH